ncbi:MAG TPA: hypothetical protein VHR45_01405 [Thermoanaerobaculia bacterium]|nr:hypothetical protein [Thermoanaerobaculia bacterium]
MISPRPARAELAGAALPAAGALRELAAREGIDSATTLFYRSVLESPVHGPFIRRVAEICKRPAPAAWSRQATLALVPAAHYRENPGSGADGRLLREQAERLGCATEIIPIASTGTVRQNGRIICDWLAQRPSLPLVLASLSKGGADVKMALAEADAAGAFSRVAVWLNLCGTLTGTPLAEWLLSQERGAVLTRFYYRLRGQSLSFLGDLRYGAGSPLDFELRLPPHLRLINIVGFPLREHLAHGISRRSHRRLSALGPNDASLVLADVCALPGLVFPIWGADHYLQPKGDVRQLIAGILQFLDESWEWPPARSV